MSGESDLDALIAGMAPALDPTPYCFITVAKGAHPEADALMRFQETEGDTLILVVEEAERLALPHEARYARITLTIHSDLEAVGLTAAFATCLGDAGIPANVVAGYYHDHIFVPQALADEAMRALEDLSSRASG